MCNEKQKIIFHRFSECEKIVQTMYNKRHDKVAKLVYWNLYKKFELDHARNWYAHTAEKVIGESSVSRQNSERYVIQVHRPDSIVKDKETDHTWSINVTIIMVIIIIDIAVLGDSRTEEKEREEVGKDQNLAKEIQIL